MTEAIREYSHFREADRTAFLDALNAAGLGHTSQRAAIRSLVYTAVQNAYVDGHRDALVQRGFSPALRDHAVTELAAEITYDAAVRASRAALDTLQAARAARVAAQPETQKTDDIESLRDVERDSYTRWAMDRTPENKQAWVEASAALEAAQFRQEQETRNV